MPSSHVSNGSNKSDVPTYEDAIEPASTHPVEIHVRPKSDGEKSDADVLTTHEDSREEALSGQHGEVELIGDLVGPETVAQEQQSGRRSKFDFLAGRGSGWFQYMKTREFWIVMLLR